MHRVQSDVSASLLVEAHAASRIETIGGKKGGGGESSNRACGKRYPECRVHLDRKYYLSACSGWDSSIPRRDIVQFVGISKGMKMDIIFKIGHMTPIHRGGRTNTALSHEFKNGPFFVAPPPHRRCD